MGTIRDDVFLGTTEKYNEKLELLSKLAQPEKWTYKKIQDEDPYRILRNYIQYTYNRIKEENKFIESANGEYRCMNTGLLTIYNQEIVAIMARNTETGESKIQLLAPLYFPGAPVRLALVLDKVKYGANEYYEGITVLPVEWAYMNSRLIVKPDEEWAKIMDEIDIIPEEEISSSSLDSIK